MRKPTQLKRLIVGTLWLALVLSWTATKSDAQKINKQRPSVYLSFGEFIKISGDKTPQADGVRLVLHNNTRWPIYYGEWIESVLLGDVAMIYTVELSDGCRDVRRHVEVVTRGKLLAEKTVSFVVPREDFPKGSAIYVGFEFSWEIDRGSKVRDEAIHRAYFFTSDLPR